MRPLAHIVSSVAVVLSAAAWLRLPAGEAAAWAVLAAVAAFSMDLDHFILQYMMADRRHIVVNIITHPLEYLDSQKIVDKFHYPGFGVLRLKSHLAIAAAATAVSLLLKPPYSTPVTLSLWVHLITDIIETIRLPESR